MLDYRSQAKGKRSGDETYMMGLKKKPWRTITLQSEEEESRKTIGEGAITEVKKNEKQERLRYSN